jgi:hypothetical protein
MFKVINIMMEFGVFVLYKVFAFWQSLSIGNAIWRSFFRKFVTQPPLENGSFIKLLKMQNAN